MRFDQAGCLFGAVAASGLTAITVTVPVVASEVTPQQLEEVIVSARKRDENILQVPVSVTAFDGSALEQIGASQLFDFVKSAPGIAISDRQVGIQEINIRGISSTQGDSVVGFYMDEVSFAFVGSNSVPDVRTYDLERVEILRGPQGTLFGDGALGGVVRIITKDPALDRFEVKADYSVSDTDRSDGSNSSIKAAVNVPIVDGKIALRLVGSKEKTAGWIDEVDPVSGALIEKDRNGREVENLRAKLRITPNDRLDIVLGAWHSDDEGGGQPFAGADNATVSFLPKSENSQSYDIYSITATYDAGPFSIVNAGAVMDYDSAAVGNLSGLAFTFSTSEDLIQNELRFQSNNDGRFHWTGGLYFRKIDREALTDFPAFNLLAIQSLDSQAWAVFGEGTWQFTDKFDVTTGLRYFEDSRSRRDVPDLIGQQESDFSSVSPRLNLTYRPSANWIVYGNIAKGFRSGQIQSLVSLIATNFTAPIGIQEETLWSYEIGTKGTMLDGRLTFEGAVYYNDWQDLQLNRVLSSTVSALMNGGDAATTGIEFSLTYRPITGLSLQATGSFINAEFTEDGPPGVAVQDGDRISGVPKQTLTGAITYQWPLFANLNGYVRTSVQYTSDTVDLINAVEPSDELTQVDARIGINGEHWGAYLFGSNLTNEDGGLTPPAEFAFGETLRSRPRTIGLNVTVSF